MKQNSLITSFLFSSLILVSTQASAQTCDISSLGNCLYNTGVTCRNSLTGCSTDVKAGRSLPDVSLHATQSCCRFTGKNKKKKQNDCFKKLEVNYGVASQKAGPLKSFIKEARKTVAAVRRAGCSTGSNT